jgi:hypothetical protein
MLRSCGRDFRDHVTKLTAVRDQDDRLVTRAVSSSHWVT